MKRCISRTRPSSRGWDLLWCDKYKGKIFMLNGHIALDCGAAYGLPLGCLRLDDMKEFYVE